jgi:hypothetical protein
MKTKSIIISGLCLLTLSVILSSFINKTILNSSRTEDYAIVDVVQSGKKKFIRVTKGAEPTTETEWKLEKTENRADFTPIIAVLNQLNEQGFELLNASLAYETVSGANFVMYGDARHTFMLVKKIK